MAVFDDPKKELERLHAQLLEQEDWFERELDSAKRMIGQMPESRSPQPTAPAKSAPKASSAEPVRKKAKPAEKKKKSAPKKKGIRNLLIIAGLELLGILGVVAYWLRMLL